MNKYKHLKEKAQELRKDGYKLPKICEMLNINKSTIYEWLKEMPDYVSERNHSNKSLAAALAANKIKYKNLRNSAYEEGKILYMNDEKNLRDFALLYLTEGHRKTKHTPSICNSNPNIVLFAKNILEKYSSRKLDYGLQYHIDQDENELKNFWSRYLSINSDVIKLTRKSNSGNLKGRKWASVHGILMVRTNDSYLREKIQAWMDIVEHDWKIMLTSPLNSSKIDTTISA